MSSAAQVDPRVPTQSNAPELGSALVGERLIMLAKLAAAAHMAQVLRDTPRQRTFSLPRSA
ncbi:MAG: hypothetical protein J0L61_10345 [Planctomycetes bacterium]|nr:hypothetical protein [Planctomycetota bacterium]